MVRIKAKHTIHYRPKSSGDSLAFGFRSDMRKWLGDPLTLSIAIYPILNSNQDRLWHLIHFREHPEGFLINFKPKDVNHLNGEIATTYKRFAILPPEGTAAGGDVECFPTLTKSGKHAITARVFGWIDSAAAQETLFGLTGVLLLPNRITDADTDPVVCPELEK